MRWPPSAAAPGLCAPGVAAHGGAGTSLRLRSPVPTASSSDEVLYLGTMLNDVGCPPADGTERFEVHGPNLVRALLLDHGMGAPVRERLELPAIHASIRSPATRAPRPATPAGASSSMSAARVPRRSIRHCPARCSTGGRGTTFPPSSRRCSLIRSAPIPNRSACRGWNRSPRCTCPAPCRPTSRRPPRHRRLRLRPRLIYQSGQMLSWRQPSHDACEPGARRRPGGLLRSRRVRGGLGEGLSDGVGRVEDQPGGCVGLRRIIGTGEAHGTDERCEARCGPAERLGSRYQRVGVSPRFESARIAAMFLAGGVVWWPRSRVLEGRRAVDANATSSMKRNDESSPGS